MHILISTLPLVKVAGFSVGGVMVSTIGSDLVDRGSTPFLPTTFISYIWVFVVSHWSVKIGGFYIAARCRWLHIALIRQRKQVRLLPLQLMCFS